MKQTQITKPIFIIGTGRCGSTMFHKLFAYHPQLAWLTWFCDRFPSSPKYNRWHMRAINLPVIGNYLTKKIYPGECWRFWDYHCRGFSTPYRDLRKDDITETGSKKITKALGEIVTRKRNRLLIKLTGWPRIGYIKEIFPDAKFIHIIRDGRAVTNSLINVDFWRGWQGPQSWRWGLLNEEQMQEWKKYEESFFILAAMEWKILIQSVEKAKEQLDTSQFLELKYEDIISNPVDSFKQVCSFCELEWNNKFQKQIEKRKLKTMNYKWKENLPVHQQEMLNEYLTDYLKKYNYE